MVLVILAVGVAAVARLVWADRQVKKAHSCPQKTRWLLYKKKSLNLFFADFIK